MSKLGYSKKVGLLSLGSDGSGAQRGGQESLRSQVSDATAQLIDAEVRVLMANAYATCHRLLQQHQTSLVTFADELVAREVLLADDIQRLLGQRPLAAQQAAALYDRSDASSAGWTAAAQQAKRSRGRSWAAASTASTAPRNPEVAAAVHAVNVALLIEEQAVGRLTNNPAITVSTVFIPASSSSSSSSSSSISGSKSSGAQSQAAVAATPAPKQPLFAQRLWAQCGGLLAPLTARFGGAGVAFAVAAACGYFRGAI